MKTKHNYICSRCGAFLDAGEHCDCEEREKETEKAWLKKLRTDSSGQLAFTFGEALHAG